MNKKDLGRIGEHKAINYLMNNGYTIIEKNYSSRYGEIDIIARNNEYIVFIEVKTRTTIQYGMPCQAVDVKKQEKIGKVASMYISNNDIKDEEYRFDVIEVLTCSNKTEISHIIDAFQPRVI